MKINNNEVLMPIGLPTENVGIESLDPDNGLGSSQESAAGKEMQFKTPELREEWKKLIEASDGGCCCTTLKFVENWAIRMQIANSEESESEKTVISNFLEDIRVLEDHGKEFGISSVGVKHLLSRYWKCGDKLLHVMEILKSSI